LDAVRAHIDDPKALRAELAARKGHLLAVGPAAQRVVDYAADACGVKLGNVTDGGSSVPPSSATTTTKPQRELLDHLHATLDHVVDDAVLLGLLGGEPAVALGVLFHLLD